MLDKKRSDYKQTPIGLLPVDWKIDRVDKNFEFLPSNSFSRVDLLYQPTVTGIQNVHYGDLHSKFKFEILDCNEIDLPYIKDELLVNKKFNFIQDGDLIIADASEDYEGVGESVEIKNVGAKKITSGLHTFLARDKSQQTALGFRTYIFKHQKVRIELKKIATGTSVFSISKSQLGKLLIPIPPLPEQQKIASILSTWDEAIAKQKLLVEQTKKRNQGLTQQLLTGKKRLKGFEGEWKTLKIKDFAFEQSIKNKENQDFVVLSCTKHNGLVPSLEYFGRQIFSENLETYKIVEKGSFAYATNHIEEGSIGYQRTFDHALISPMYTVFKTDNTIVDEFLFKLLKSHSYIHEYQKRMEGSIDRRGGLRWSEFAKIKVEVPELKEQNAINEFLEIGNKELLLLEQQLTALQNEKKGLMQKLLTGEVRVKLN